MPVEVREVVIQAKAVSKKGNRQHKGEEQSYLLAQQQQGLSDDERDEIIQACIREMLEILEDRERR